MRPTKADRPALDVHQRERAGLRLQPEHADALASVVEHLHLASGMRQALDVGDRTVMLHQGKVVLDVSGEQRQGLDVRDLLEMFERVRGETLADDSLLLG